MNDVKFFSMTNYSATPVLKFPLPQPTNTTMIIETVKHYKPVVARICAPVERKSVEDGELMLYLNTEDLFLGPLRDAWVRAGFPQDQLDPEKCQVTTCLAMDALDQIEDGAWVTVDATAVYAWVDEDAYHLQLRPACTQLVVPQKKISCDWKVVGKYKTPKRPIQPKSGERTVMVPFTLVGGLINSMTKDGLPCKALVRVDANVFNSLGLVGGEICEITARGNTRIQRNFYKKGGTPPEILPTSMQLWVCGGKGTYVEIQVLQRPQQ